MTLATMRRIKQLITAFAFVGLVLGVIGVVIMYADDARATARPCPTQQTDQRHGQPCKPCPSPSTTASSTPSTAPVTAEPAYATTDGKGPYHRRPTCQPSTPPTTPPTTRPTTRPTPSASVSVSPSPSVSPADPTPTATADPPPPGATLPLTGASAGIAATIAVTLVISGLVLVYTGRRRRTRYVA